MHCIRGAATEWVNTVKTNSTKSAPAPKLDDAVALAMKVVSEEGACAAIRAVAVKYPDLKRCDLMEVGAYVGINPFTTSRQFHLARKR
jgi:hypothetical protein